MATQNTLAQNILVAVLLVIILVFIGVTGYFGIGVLWEAFSSLDPRVGATVGVVVGAIVAGLFAMRTKRIEEAAALRERLREKKVPTLEQFVALVFDGQFAAKKGQEPLTEEETVKRMVNITQELIIWGSDDMLLQFHAFREASLKQASGSGHPLQTVFAVEDLLLAIRKDAGHKNKGLKRGSILRLFINDLPKLD